MPPFASSSYSSCSSSSSTPPSTTTSSRSQWALPDLNRERQISVGTAGPQLRPPDLSGHCWTSTTSTRSQWALPDPNCDCQISVLLPYQISGEAAISASHGFRGSFADLSRIYHGFLGYISRHLRICLIVYIYMADTYEETV